MGFNSTVTMAIPRSYPHAGDVCFLCTREIDHVSMIPGTDNSFVQCPNCGDFGITREAYVNISRSIDRAGPELAILSHAIRRMQYSESTPLVHARMVDAIVSDRTIPPIRQQINNLISYLGWTAERAQAPEEFQSLTARTCQALIGARTASGAGWVIRAANERGLIEGERHSIFDDDDEVDMSGRLSVEGWQKYEEISTLLVDSRVAFMAMKFGDKELDRVVNTVFRPAVKAAGFELQRLDDNPSAGLIDDRLRVEIRKSKFLISDLTHANHGAYWEAGFAEGLGLPVIYTCRMAEFNDPELKPHFDTNHHLTVVWDPDDLPGAAEQLKNTIRATLPDVSKMSDR